MFTETIAPLFGGVGLLLLGMHLMSSNLEAVAGSRLKKWIERLTSNRFLGVLVGAGITAIIQSSAATTVMVVGFVNSGLMTLVQSVWVIMGANIGTTITGVLGVLGSLKIDIAAYIICFVGVVLIFFFTSKKVKSAGSIVAGFGMLFIGLSLIKAAIEPLSQNEAFLGFFSHLSNPFLGVLMGALFTAVLQSSSASVLILQALIAEKIIGIEGALFVLYGQNIGTCITAFLASIGANRNAKRATIIHLMFNVIGALLFILITLVTPYAKGIASIAPGHPELQIALSHIIFNLTTTALLLPFGKYLAALAGKILPDKKRGKSSEDKWLEEIINNRHTLGASVIAVRSLTEELVRMMGLAAENVDAAFRGAAANDPSRLDEVRDREEEIDRINYDLSKKISKVLTLEESLQTIRVFNGIFRASSNVERIGDHALNVAEYVELLRSKDMGFSEQARAEIGEMRAACSDAMDLLRTFGENGNSRAILEGIEAFEQSTDDLTEVYRANQNERIRAGTVETERLLVYSELLVDFERIGDHALNIAEELSGLEWEKADKLSAPKPAAEEKGAKDEKQGKEQKASKDEKTAASDERAEKTAKEKTAAAAAEIPAEKRETGEKKRG